MPNENENREAEDLKDDDLEVQETDQTDWKAEAEKLKQKAIRQREKTRSLRDQLRQAQATKAPDPIVPDLKNKKEFDDTEHLLLDVKNVSTEDRDWLFKEVETTGKSLRQVLSFKYIQDELKDREQNRASEKALPQGNNRSGVAPKDTAEHWLQKIEEGKANILQIPDPKLRAEVHKIRKARSQGNESPFTENPVV